MPARNQFNLYWTFTSYVSTNTKFILTCSHVREDKKCDQKLSHASEDRKCISSCVYQTPTMSPRTKMPLNMCWQVRHLWKHGQKYIWTCVDNTLPMPKKTLNVLQTHVLIKLIPCKRRHKIYLNSSWPNDSEDTKLISTCVDQTTPMPPRTQN